MTDTTAAPPAADPAAGAGAPPAVEPPAVEKPAWVTDGTFDAERAYTRIQAMQADLEKARTDRDKYKQIHDDAESAKLTDLQRLERERDKHRDAAQSATVELARLRAAMKHGLAEDDLDLLGSGTPDEIEARAARLAERIGATAGGPPPSRRPAERLRGGGDPTRAPEVDIREMVSKIPRGL